MKFETESLKEFYKRKYNEVPDNVKQKIGHFNLFPLEPIEKGKTRSLPYRRRDFYKVMLVIGPVEFHYADRMESIEKQALVFSNPMIPYKCDHLDKIQGGQYCIFNTSFFEKFGALSQYSVFQPNGKHVFELSNDQVKKIEATFQKMSDDFNSDYIHKNDALRNHVYELLHFAMKLEPSSTFDVQKIDASNRISTLFLELLERQFPIEENHPTIKLRSASQFAGQLNIHVNHLNRTIKNTLGKSTSQIIADRLLQEAKILLKHSQWNISEVAYALGFKEATHFNNFFKKYTQLSPSKFRKM